MKVMFVNIKGCSYPNDPTLIVSCAVPVARVSFTERVERHERASLPRELRAKSNFHTPTIFRKFHSYDMLVQLRNLVCTSTNFKSFDKISKTPSVAFISLSEMKLRTAFS